MYIYIYIYIYCLYRYWNIFDVDLSLSLLFGAPIFFSSFLSVWREKREYREEGEGETRRERESGNEKMASCVHGAVRLLDLGAPYILFSLSLALRRLVLAAASAPSLSRSIYLYMRIYITLLHPFHLLIRPPPPFLETGSERRGWNGPMASSD